MVFLCAKVDVLSERFHRHGVSRNTPQGEKETEELIWTMFALFVNEFARALVHTGIFHYPALRSQREKRTIKNLILVLKIA